MELDSWQASSLSLFCLIIKYLLCLPISSGVHVGIKLRPRGDELHELGPDFQARWKDYFANKPDKPIVTMLGGARYVFNL